MPRTREVLLYPDERLQRVARPVGQGETISEVVEDLIHTMYLHEAVGLAAPQIGVELRLFCLDGAYFNRPGSGPIVVINPEVVDVSSEKVRRREGCLSFPGEFVHIKRPAWLVVRYLNERAETVEVDTREDDLLSLAMLHEIDHLDGRLMVDVADPRTRRKLKSRSPA